MTGTPHWENQPPGPESMWRGAKGDKGDPGMGGGVARAIVFLFAFSVLVAAVSLIYTTRTANHLRSEVQSQCRFDADLGGVPVTLNPATHRPSPLGVKIVSDARVAWQQAGCPGTLPPAAPSFTRWAKFYHLPTG